LKKNISAFLAELEIACIRTGIVTNEQQQILREHLGRDADFLVSALSNSYQDEAIRVRHFLSSLGSKRNFLDVMIQINGGEKSIIISPDDQTDSLLRYYAFYSREADRAMAELERLQRRRLGEGFRRPLT